MVTIHFLRRAPIQINEGSLLMESLQASGVPVASSCGGDGVCRKCKVRVVKGMENLDPASEFEQSLIDRDSLSRDQRISCQVVVRGDITIDAPYW